MKTEEVRSKTDTELAFDLAKMRKELFGMRFKGATETSANPARIEAVRRSIARIQTVLHERATGIRGQEPR
jgi:large subunit ribosomal protein L29